MTDSNRKSSKSFSSATASHGMVVVMVLSSSTRLSPAARRNWLTAAERLSRGSAACMKNRSASSRRVAPPCNATNANSKSGLWRVSFEPSNASPPSVFSRISKRVGLGGPVSYWLLREPGCGPLVPSVGVVFALVGRHDHLAGRRGFLRPRSGLWDRPETRLVAPEVVLETPHQRLGVPGAGNQPRRDYRLLTWHHQHEVEQELVGRMGDEGAVRWSTTHRFLVDLELQLLHAVSLAERDRT